MRRIAALVVMSGLASLTASAQEPLTLSAAQGVRAKLAPKIVAAPRSPGARHPLRGEPADLVTSDELLDILGDLTAIRAYGGWRTATSRGETEAVAWVQGQLSELGFLEAIGLESSSESFHTYIGIDFWETRVELTRDGTRYEVPAEAQYGHRDVLDLAMRFDSDGTLNDSHRDPVVVEGPQLVVRDANHLYALTPSEVAGRVVVLDFAVVDRSIIGTNEAVTRAWVLMEQRPAAVVLVTTFSNEDGVSHGSFSAFLSAFTYVEPEPGIPILNLRMEDLASAGVTSWADFFDLESLRVTWDVDLQSPGTTSYLMARIPGEDSSRAVILGAHIDSPNSPGGFDNGSGSSALVEVARVLDRARFIPPIDVHLVWFGGHEIGLYGSSNFTALNGELLDRAAAMIQMDCLGRPMDGVENDIWVEGWSYARHGDGGLPWADYLFGLAASRGITTKIADVHGLVSDNSSFAGYGVPGVNMIFMNPLVPIEVHYGNHLHDPYETVGLAAEVADDFDDMATIMAMAASRTGEDDEDFRVTPTPDRRAVFVASHTEGIHMTPAGLTQVGMTLAWEGFDVDTVPYGQLVTDDDIADADLVIVLPVHDYPSPDGDPNVYDEAWTDAEIDVLDDYVLGGGMLVLTNTARRLKYINLAYDENEDWSDVNVLADRFGVSYHEELLSASAALSQGGHPLVQSAPVLRFTLNNAHRFNIDGGETLYAVGLSPAAAIKEVGAGEVVVLADLSMLGATQDPPRNLGFWQNLARYAR